MPVEPVRSVGSVSSVESVRSVKRVGTVKITRFEELECWQEGRTLTKMIFTLTNESLFRKYGFRLIDQITGAAISVMNNIVEGFDRQFNAEVIRFLGYARRSATEVQTCLYAALDNQMIGEAKFQETYQQAQLAQRV